MRAGRPRARAERGPRLGGGGDGTGGGHVRCRRRGWGGRPPARSSDTDADRHVRDDRGDRAARPARGRRWPDERVEEQGSQVLPAAHQGRRRADRRSLSGRHEHAPGAPRPGRTLRRGRRQGCRQPHLAQSEERLGRLERPRPRRRADGAADPRRDGRPGPARPQGDLGLAPGRARRPPRRAEGPAGGQDHGWRERGGLARLARRSRHARAAAARSHHRRRCPASKRRSPPSGRPCRRSGCTVHKHRNLLAHAPDKLHEEISADYQDMIYAATAKEIEQRRKAFLRKWRLKCRAVADSLEEAGEQLFTFTRLPASQWKSARTTNAIERLHEEFKRRIKTQTVLPSAETAAMLFWALLASGQITMRKVDGWPTLARRATDRTIDLAA